MNENWVSFLRVCLFNATGIWLGTLCMLRQGPRKYNFHLSFIFYFETKLHLVALIGLNLGPFPSS